MTNPFLVGHVLLMNKTDYYFLYSSSLVLSIVVSPICRMKIILFASTNAADYLICNIYSPTTALVPQHGHICQLDQRLK